MELNNIEKEIREKLNSREIQPSAQAWDRLDAMLSVAEEKKTKRSFGWLYIAAGILVFVSAGTYFYNQESTTTTINPTVVGTENATPSVKENPSIITEKETKLPATEIATSGKTDEASPTQSGIAQREKQVYPNTRGGAERSEANQNHKTNSPSVISKGKEIEYQTNSDVALKNGPKAVDPNQGISVPKTTIINQDNAVAAINKSPKANETPKVKINANSLLSEVDGELELTFREKVLKKVTKNYKEVKVAVANRNNL